MTTSNRALCALGMAMLVAGCSTSPALPENLDAVMVRVVVDGEPTVRIAPSANANARARLNAHEARRVAIPRARKGVRARLPPQKLAAAIAQHIRSLPSDALPFRATVVDDATPPSAAPTLYLVVADYGFVSSAKGEAPLLTQVRIQAQLRAQKRAQWETEVQQTRGIGPSSKAGLDVTRPSAAEVLLQVDLDQAAAQLQQEARGAVDAIAFRLRRADKRGPSP